MAEQEPFGTYVILKSIAAGGMGEIFLAKRTDPEGFEKVLVLRRMLPHLLRDDRSLSMFLNEAKLAAQLDHPNIVQIYDFGKLDETCFIAMEYVHGKNLRELLERAQRRERPLPIRQTLYIMKAVLAGLDFAHKKLSYDGKPLGIIHRGISPQNILVSYGGAVKLTDFGIAKAAIFPSDTTLGTIKGKICYLSPEQVSGERLDWRTDIFSLGIVLFEMLVGRKLFSDETGPTHVIDRIRKADVPRPRALNPEIPAELEEILLTSLSKIPEDRFQDAHEMSRAIGQVAREQGLTSEGYELATHLLNLFPEEDLGKILAEEEPLVSPAPSPRKKARLLPPPALGLGANPHGVAPVPVLTRVLLVTGVVGIIVTLLLAVVLPQFFAGSRTREGDAPALSTGLRSDPTAARPSPPAPLPTASQPPPPAHSTEPAAATTGEEESVAVVPVSTSPSGASIWIDGEPILAKTNAALKLALGRTHDIRVEKPGYEPKTWSVEVRTGKSVGSLYAPLQARPTSLALETDPPGAMVLLAGKERQAPFTLEDVPAKRYPVEAKLPGYGPYKALIEVRAGERNGLTLRLRKTAETARLSIDTRPWTKVYLDGKPLGDTPLSNAPAPTGERTLRFLNSELSLDESETIQIKPGPNVLAPRRFVGTFQFEVTGVSEYQVGRTRYARRSLSLPVGKYTVSYVGPRGSPREVVVNIRNGEVTTVR